MFINSIFSIYISEVKVENSYPSEHNFGKYYVYTDEITPFDFTSDSNRECVIFGYAVNVLTGEFEHLSQRILDDSNDIQGVIDYERHLGGKYLILYTDSTGYYMLGDATCSIPIYYCVDPDSFVCASNPYDIIKRYDLIPDLRLQKIRDSGNISQAMPYDVTEYSEIKQLLPNHFLNFNKCESNRFVNFSVKQDPMTVSDATVLVAPMIQRIVDLYNRNFQLHCPITSGRDSRVVLAYLSKISDKKITSYTIKHKEHDDNTQDVKIPKQLTESVSMDHFQIEDVEVAESDKLKVDMILGNNRYSPRTLMIAQTIKQHCQGGAVVNGDIIGQVGKCSLHRDIREIFATPRYFRCKLHNYSSESLAELKKWMQEIKSSGEKINLFDLFSVESRLGRWAGQENLIYNSIGQIYLNIFNSRSIIYIWSGVPRKLRKKSLLHINLINEKEPALLNVPFETDESLCARISKSTAMLYLLSSYMKHFMERIRFYRRKKHEKTNNNC